jgi:ferredoxin
VEAPEGGPLVDICDAHYAPIPFSCRSATCATCHIQVLEGADLLEPPEGEEAELLRVLPAPPGSRLACQAVVRAASGVLRVKPLYD